MANLNQEEDTVNTIQDVYDGQRTSLYIYLRKVLNLITGAHINKNKQESIATITCPPLLLRWEQISKTSIMDESLMQTRMDLIPLVVESFRLLRIGSFLRCVRLTVSVLLGRSVGPFRSTRDG